jgi:predicted ABC-type exoprotein transport system permease subunit
MNSGFFLLFVIVIFAFVIYSAFQTLQSIPLEFGVSIIVFCLVMICVVVGLALKSGDDN